MFTPLSYYRLVVIRQQERLADAEKHRQLRHLASPDNIRAARKPYAVSTWFERFRRQLIAQFSN